MTGPYKEITACKNKPEGLTRAASESDATVENTTRGASLEKTTKTASIKEPVEDTTNTSYVEASTNTASVKKTAKTASVEETTKTSTVENTTKTSSIEETTKTSSVEDTTKITSFEETASIEKTASVENTTTKTEGLKLEATTEAVDRAQSRDGDGSTQQQSSPTCPVGQSTPETQVIVAYVHVDSFCAFHIESQTLVFMFYYSIKNSL